MPKVLLFKGRQGHTYVVDPEYHQVFLELQEQVAQAERFVSVPANARDTQVISQLSERRSMIRHLIRRLTRLDRLLSAHRE